MLFRRGVSCHCMPPCLNLSGCMGLSVCVSSNKQGSFFLRVTGNSCRRLFCLFNCCWDINGFASHNADSEKADERV